MNFKIEKINIVDEDICIDYIGDLTEEQEEICEECDFCEKAIGLCPNYNGGNGKISWMGVNSVDNYLEMKRNR